MTARTGGSPIAPTIIGQGGRVPPNRIIDNDSTGDVDTNPVFDPQQDGIDFHESIEGMLVQFNDAVATGPTERASARSRSSATTAATPACARRAAA